MSDDKEKENKSYLKIQWDIGISFLFCWYKLPEVFYSTCEVLESSRYQLN
jgi:hypothetical protein